MTAVTRPGDGEASTDWFPIVTNGLDLSQFTKCSLIIDNSGSMDRDTVGGDIRKFRAQLGQNNIYVTYADFTSENYIVPHLSAQFPKGL